jgi:hypothetical protein
MTARGYQKSSPGFFRLIKISLALLILLLAGLAVLIPAPLQEPANFARVPNPVKSAWFLLWIQELVSYSKYLIFLVLGLAAAFTLLPWLPGQRVREHAIWLGRNQLPACLVALGLFLGICTLTVIGLFFRGENWTFVLPF